MDDLPWAVIYYSAPQGSADFTGTLLVERYATQAEADAAAAALNVLAGYAAASALLAWSGENSTGVMVDE